eukprot:6194142-Pleurochrysis_carterae.AAC.2
MTRQPTKTPRRRCCRSSAARETYGLAVNKETATRVERHAHTGTAWRACVRACARACVLACVHSPVRPNSEVSEPGRVD